MSYLHLESDSDLHLDCSWIEKEEKMGDLHLNSYREPMKDIAMFFVYVNSDFAIEQITKENERVVNDSISKERLLQIIQKKRHHISTKYGVNKKYRLDDILSFQIDLGPDGIESFLRADLENMSDAFLKSVPIFNEIDCLPSIFIFHDINSLYFIFREIEASGKSILKNGGSSGRGTKKVRIADLPIVPATTAEYKRKSVKAKLSAFKKSMKARG
jgi:hypothetical protein